MVGPFTKKFKPYGWSFHRDLGDSHSLDSYVWKDLLSGLDFFRRMTKVTVGNGLFSAFWLDLWLGDDTLASRFPALSFPRQCSSWTALRPFAPDFPMWRFLNLANCKFCWLLLS